MNYSKPQSGGDLKLIMDIRVASRTLVRELGFMNKYLAGTHLTPSQVHTLLELESRPGLNAAVLKQVLRLDKSATSRLVSDLIRRGYVEKSTSKRDSRSHMLTLSHKGKTVLVSIHRRANRQIGSALGHLTPDEKQKVREGLQLFAQALTTLHSPWTSPAKDSVQAAIEEQ